MLLSHATVQGISSPSLPGACVVTATAPGRSDIVAVNQNKVDEL
jgi:hypothetical protein